MLRRTLRGSLVALGLSALLVPATFASTDTTISVAQGELTISSPGAANFGGITLNGAGQSAVATLDGFTVMDARGTGAGWHVTVQAEQFKEWNGSEYVGGGKSLDAGSLEMSEPDVSPDEETTSPGPQMTMGPYVLDNGSAVTIASAAVDTGMGTYEFSASDLTLALSPSVYARTYRSTITFSVVNGP